MMNVLYSCMKCRKYKGIIRNRKSTKGRQYNGQTEKNKMANNGRQRTMNGELRCFV